MLNRKDDPMKEITPHTISCAEVEVPGSKSYTHRVLIASALSDGDCTIDGGLHSEDTLLTLDALRRMGTEIDIQGRRFVVRGTGGRLTAPAEPVFLGNSGTSMRLLTAIACLADGKIVLTGTLRMQERPVRDLMDALRQVGVDIRSANGNGCPPVEIQGGPVKGGAVGVNCTVSSQYLSALLLLGPRSMEGLDISITEGLVSRPYVDMTVDVMGRFGVSVERDGYDRFFVPGNQVYRSGTYAVEPDASQAGYFWAAAAVTGGTVKVKGITRNSRQGDVRLAELFAAMGCKASYEPDGIALTGGPLSGVEADMADMPDMVPTLAVVAAFAKGETVIKNVAHLKVKESDRLGSVAAELNKMGVAAQATESGLIIRGGHPKGADIETYNDHRMAMSFAVAGLVVPGVRIHNPACVEKSFPDFWEVFETLYGKTA